MKIKFIVLVIIVLALSATMNAQPTSTSESYKNLFKVSASMFTRNTFQMGFEHFVTPSNSMLVNFGMTFRDADYDRIWGLNAEAQYRFHVFTQVKPKNSHRLYFAPYLAGSYTEEEDYVWESSGTQRWSKDTYTAFGTGVVFGWSFSFGNRINLDIYTGGGIRKAFDVDKEYFDGIWDYGYSGITPRFGLDVGFWF